MAAILSSPQYVNRNIYCISDAWNLVSNLSAGGYIFQYVPSVNPRDI